MKSQPAQNVAPAHGVSRRRFLLSTGAAATGAALFRSPFAMGADPNRKLRIGGVGIGGQGFSDLQECATEEIVALCDVDWSYAKRAAERFPQARRYRDFREMLDKEKNNLDAVVIGTPDHTHAIVSAAALKAGKHVYCEKPLTRTVTEARRVAELARRSGLATQMGNQGMAFEGNRLIKEWLQDGAIGPVHEVHVWSDRPTHKGKMPLWWPQGIERPKDTPPVPESLDWELWQGPAPQRPYHPAYVPFKWRGWWDYGSGGLGDMGIHNLAPVFDALRLGPPTSVCASSSPVFAETVPVAATVHYDFPARDGLPAVKLHWYDGGMMPPRPEELEDDRDLDREDGVIFVGEKGKMLVEGWGGERPMLIPDKRMDAYKRPPKSLPRSAGHHKEWIQACKTGSATASDFSFAGPLTEAVLLGSVCIRLEGRKLVWDSANLRVTNLPAANDYLHYPYRSGWEL